MRNKASKIIDPYYPHDSRYNWKEKVRKILSTEYIKYRKENCHEFRQAFSVNGRRQIQECRLEAQIYAAEKGIDFLKILVPKNQVDQKQIQGAISILLRRITDYKNISIY